MFQPWRLKVREAEEALRQGRLEEASRLLAERGLLEFLPAQRLMAKVAHEMTQRAQKQFVAGATMAGWQDLATAERLGAEQAELAGLKQQFVDRGLCEAEAYLTAGDPAAAVERLEALERQGATGREFRLVREAAGKVLNAQQLCQAGKFAQAEEELAAALVLRPGWQVLEEIRQACVTRGSRTRCLVEELHGALSQEDWTMALARSEAILELCPSHAPAIDARRRAWAVVGMELPKAPITSASAFVMNNQRSAVEAGSRKQPMTDHTPTSDPPAERFLLWVDGVGGYMVCRGDVISLGQPVQGSYVDVPVLGDISRLHARIRRDGESYLIEPCRATRVDGRVVESATLLSDGSEIELGDGVRFRFRVPNPLSRTARLDFISRHRTQPTTDGVLLLAESCIMGPGSTAHIVCRDWTNEVVLFPQGDDLFCRASGQYQVDGHEVEGRAPITRSSQIVGEDFSLSLEKL
ncbi:MAG TPA: FHA domain-containing protein [Pirellulales bacterium]|jgi:hypothetical protein